MSFSPGPKPAQFRFPFEGDPPATVPQRTAELRWHASVSAISAIPVSVARARLQSGPMIRDLSVGIGIEVGTASSVGQAVYDDNLKSWGYVAVVYEPVTALDVRLHLSRQLFARLVRWAERGVLPEITVRFGRHNALRTSIVDGRLETWADEKEPLIHVQFGEFRALLPAPVQRGV